MTHQPIDQTAHFPRPYDRVGLTKRALMLGCILYAGVGPVNAMDLLQAYTAARQQDATILASRAAALIGQERLPQARAQQLVNITATVGRNNNQLASTTPNLLGVEQTTSTSYPSSNQTITARQPLYRPFLAAQYRQAVAQVNDANATLAQEEQNLAVRVALAYFEAALNKEQLALILSQRTAYTSQLDAANKALAGGTGTRTDIDEAQARLDMALALELEARQNGIYTLQQLGIIVNQRIDQVATLNVQKLQLLRPDPDSLDEWTRRAELNSPQLQSLRAQLEAARQEVEKANAGHLPTLDAIAQWSRSTSESVTNVSNRYTNKSLGLQLNIPIFSGGLVNSQIRQNLAAQERAEQTLEAAKRDLALRIFKEFRGVAESVPKIKALEQSLASSDQLVLSSRKSFTAGSRTALDVLNAEQQRTVVLRDLAQARYIYLLSKIRLLALNGEASVDAIAAINMSFEPY